MNAAQPAPAGLGGWLWPITWLTAALPLPPTVWLLDGSLAALYLILRHGEVPYPQTESWWLQIHAVLLFLTLCAWWWAIHWFARDPRLPRQGPWVLLACALLIAGIGRSGLNDREYAILVSTPLCLAAMVVLASRFSKRMRNTFTAHPSPAPAPGWRGVLFCGPREWSHRRWLLPGVLVYAALALWSQLPIHAAAAFEPIPPPPPAPESKDGTGNAAALSAMFHPGPYIEASRVALSLSIAAAMLLALALVGLARGARWMPLAAFAALMLAMGGAMWMSFRDWCCPFLDGPEYERMWRAWCLVILIATFGGAFRRWPEPPPPAKSP